MCANPWRCPQVRISGAGRGGKRTCGRRYAEKETLACRRGENKRRRPDGCGIVEFREVDQVFVCCSSFSARELQLDATDLGRRQPTTCTDDGVALFHIGVVGRDFIDPSPHPTPPHTLLYACSQRYTHTHIYIDVTHSDI